MSTKSSGWRRARNRAASFLLAVMAPLALGCSDPHVLVVGLDSASWRVIEPLMEAGLVPNIARIVGRGARADLDCVPADRASACFCPPVWTSIATGTDFESHRIRSFFEPSTERRSKAIWNVAAEHGARVVTSSWRGAWPPEPGIDFVFTEPGLDQAAETVFDVWGPINHPARALPEPLDHPADIYEQLGFYPPPASRATTWAPFARDRVAMEAVLRLEKSRPYEDPWERETELTMVLIHAPDRTAHLLWGLFQEVMHGPFDVMGYLDNTATWRGPVTGPAPFSWGAMAGPYLEADAWLGELLESGDYDYIVFASDHGMTRNPDPGFYGHHHPRATEAHRGVFSMTGPGIRPGEWLGTVSVLDVAPTLAYLLNLPVAEDLPGRVLTEGFDDEWLKWQPVETVASWEDPAP